MAIVRPLNLLQSEWELLQNLGTHAHPFYLNDVFLLYNKENLDKYAFYKRFFWLQVCGFIRVAHFGNMKKEGYANVTYTLSSLGHHTLAQHVTNGIAGEEVNRLAS